MRVTTAAEQQTWTILSLLNWSTEHLETKGFDSPRLTVELLLAHVLKCSRIDLYVNFDKPVSHDERAEFRRLFQRRLAYEPVQYLVGETDFMGMPLTIDRRVLIPRPETEVLVEQVVHLSENYSLRNLLDIGTGSGNIAIGIAARLQNSEIDAVDISAEALEVARHNIVRHRLEDRIHLQQLNILEPGVTLPRATYDCIISNPPYVSSEEFQMLQPEVKDFEPVIATTDHADGMTFYRVMARIAKSSLRPNGWIAVEIAYNQSEAIKALFRNEGYGRVDAIRDYEGIERVIMAQWLNA